MEEGRDEKQNVMKRVIKGERNKKGHKVVGRKKVQQGSRGVIILE